MSKGAGAHGPHNEIQWNGFGRILLTHTAPYSAHAFPAPVAPPTKGIHAHRSTHNWCCSVPLKTAARPPASSLASGPKLMSVRVPGVVSGRVSTQGC